MSPLVVATVRVLSRRSIVLWWVIGLFAGFFWALLAWFGANNLGTPTQSALLIWRVVMALSLLFLGAQLATAALDTARGDDALQPRRRRALADATVWLGCAQLLLFLAATALLGLLMNAWTPSWPIVAEASMALTVGVGVVIGVSQRRYRLALEFLSVAVPLLGYALTPGGALIGAQAHWAVYAAWLAAWPACALVVWWVLCKRLATLHRLPTLQHSAAIAHDLSARPHRGIEPMLGHAQWLLRIPPSEKWFAQAAGCGVLILIMVWFSRNSASPNVSLLLITTVGWWATAYDVTREGVRPTLLLLPGGRMRRRLGWMLFFEGLRRSLPMVWWTVAAGAALIWFHPQLELLPLVVAGVMLWAGGALSLACWLSLWVWLRRPVWRAVAQWLAAGSCCVITVLGTAHWYQHASSSDGAGLALGFLAAALATGLSALVVTAGNRAWQRADLHALFSPSRKRFSTELS
jgi:hypothetical protein